MLKGKVKNIETVADLNPALYNPRKISDQQKIMLFKSMVEFGDLSGVVYNRKTGSLIGGHQRTSLFDPSFPVVKQPFNDSYGTVAKGYIETPYGEWTYREVEWDIKKEKMANIAANNQGGENDFTLLTMLIEEIDDGETDLDLLGFDEKELEKMFTWTKEEADDEEKTHKQLRDELKDRVKDEDDDKKHTIKINLTGDLLSYVDDIVENSSFSRSDIIRQMVTRCKGMNFSEADLI